MSSATHLFRFSLTTLFGAVLFVAFGTAAIRFASPLWAALTMSLTVPVLFAAVLGALFRLGQARAFWAGMAICGWGYLLLVLAPWFEAGLGQYLPTTQLLAYAHGQMQTQVPINSAVGSALERIGIGSDSGTTLLENEGKLLSAAADTTVRFWDATTGTGLPLTTSTGPDSGLVLRTGHALFALLFGFMGGVTAKWFYLTRSPKEAEQPR